MIHLKLKNKTIIAMDKILKDAKDKGGIPDKFIINLADAVNFLREANRCSKTYKPIIKFGYKNVNVIPTVDARIVVWSSLGDNIKIILQDWNTNRLWVRYNGVLVEIESDVAPKISVVSTPTASTNVKG